MWTTGNDSWTGCTCMLDDRPILWTRTDDRLEGSAAWMWTDCESIALEGLMLAVCIARFGGLVDENILNWKEFTLSVLTDFFYVAKFQSERTLTKNQNRISWKVSANRFETKKSSLGIDDFCICTKRLFICILTSSIAEVYFGIRKRKVILFSMHFKRTSYLTDASPVVVPLMTTKHDFLEKPDSWDKSLIQSGLMSGRSAWEIYYNRSNLNTACPSESNS